VWRRKPGSDDAPTVFKRPRGLLWRHAGACKDLAGSAASEIGCHARACSRSKTGRRERVTVAQLSGRLNILKNFQIAGIRCPRPRPGCGRSPFSRVCREMERSLRSTRCHILDIRLENNALARRLASLLCGSCCCMVGLELSVPMGVGGNGPGSVVLRWTGFAFITGEKFIRCGPLTVDGPRAERNAPAGDEPEPSLGCARDSG